MGNALPRLRVVRRRLPARLVALTLAAAAVATGCSIAPDEPPQSVGLDGPVVADRTGTPAGPLQRLTWAIPSDITTTDPQAAQDAVTRSVLANVCESVSRHLPDGTVGPGLAELTSASATSLVYTVRPGARFSDGTRVTAADVADSLRAQAAPGSAWSRRLQDVESVEVTGAARDPGGGDGNGGVGGSAGGDAGTDPGGDAGDDAGGEPGSAGDAAPDRVTVTLSRPNSLVADLLATGAGAVVRRDGPLAEPLCSGPYLIEEWRKGRSVTLVRNPAYWQSDAAGLAERVVLQVVPKPQDRAEAVLQGRVQGTYDPPRSAMKRLVAEPDVAVTYGRGTSVVSLAISNFDGPLRDVRLRRALSLAVDRPALAAGAHLTGARPAKAPSAPAQWGGTPEQMQRWFRNLPPVERSEEDARALVVEAGVPERSIVLAYGPDASTADVAAAVLDATVVTGLPLVLERLSAQEYLELQRDPTSRADIDAYVVTAGTLVADPLHLYNRFCGSAGGRGDGPGEAGTGTPRGVEPATEPPGTEAEEVDATAFDERTYDEVCERAFAETDRGRRLVLVDQMQKMVVAAHLWVPLYEVPSVVVERRDVTGALAGFVRDSTAWAATVGAGR